MRVRFLVCSESAALDARRNTLSVFHILEDFTIPAFPAVVPQMSVLTVFERGAEEPAEPNDVSVRITLNEQELYRGPVEVRFGGHLKMRWITEIRGLILAGPGLLAFTIFFGENQLAQYSIPVLNIGQPVIQPELPLQNQAVANQPAANQAAPNLAGANPVNEH